MQNLAAALASPQLQDRSFTVIGHTDGVGSASYNQRLSQRRARSVRDYLVQHGVDAGRLQTVGKGFSDLLNESDPAAAENRRVEVVASSRSEEHTSELQSLMRISYAVFCLKKKKKKQNRQISDNDTSAHQ